MAARACLMAVVSLIWLQSGSGRSADTLSPRYSSKTHPRTLDQVFMQANGPLTKGKRLGDGKVSDGLDMVLTERQYSMLYGGSEGRSQGDDDNKLFETWPNGVIPYIIQYGYFTPERILKIEEGMATWQSLTCVTFRPATSSDINLVDIQSRDGCYSMLGKIKEKEPQVLSLNVYGCFHQGTVEHELGHAIGLVHEHQRPERDNHLGVYENNVIPFFRNQLQVYSRNAVDKLGLPYDYYSLMHYGKTAFSFDGVTPTLYAYDRWAQKYLPKVTEDLGKVIGPSFLDVKLVNLMYNCSASCNPMPACGADCFVDKYCRCVCEENMPAVPCANYVAQCDQWARQGECRTNRPYTEYFCRKACKMCPDHGTLPPEEPQLPLPCEDKRSDCQALADIGDCENLRETMMMDCYKTCSGCQATDSTTDTPGGNPPSTGSSEPPTAVPCADNRADCQVLADRGDCDTNPEAMMFDCYKTCSGCGGTDTPGSSACVDDDVNCGAWAEADYCNHYPHIIPTCKKSCGACS